jgi:hypothetical protein
VLRRAMLLNVVLPALAAVACIAMCAALGALVGASEGNPAFGGVMGGAAGLWVCVASVLCCA